MTSQKEIILNFLNTYLPIVILIGFVLTTLVFIHYFYKTSKKRKSPFLDFLKSNALPLAFFATLFSSVMSLIYSDYLGEAPCGLCWFQRLFIFPQVVLFIVAYLKNDISIFKYSFWLSVVGGVIAIYHQFLQLGFNEAIPCPVTPGLVDCAKPTFISFGFVTMPFAAITLFLFLILLATLVGRKNK